MLLPLKLSIASLIFAIGLSSTLADAVFVWRRPLLLAKSLFAMYVALPLATIFIVRVFELPANTEKAMIILAICAGAPLLPKKLLKIGGDPTYLFSLVLATSLIAIVSVPAGLAALHGYLDIKSEVTSTAVAATVLRAFLLPLGAGMAVRALVPNLAERLADRILQIAGGIVAVFGVVAMVVGFDSVRQLGWPSLLAFAAFTATALATGHLLGGPRPERRVALALACASRHVGLALLVAAGYPNNRTTPLVVAYLLASALVSIPYLRWQSKRLHS